MMCHAMGGAVLELVVKDRMTSLHPHEFGEYTPDSIVEILARDSFILGPYESQRKVEQVISGRCGSPAQYLIYCIGVAVHHPLQNMLLETQVMLYIFP